MVQEPFFFIVIPAYFSLSFSLFFFVIPAVFLALFHNEWVIRNKAHDLLPFDVELSMTTSCEPAHRFDFQFCLACKLCRYLLLHSHSTKLHRVFPIQNCELKQRLHTRE